MIICKNNAPSIDNKYSLKKNQKKSEEKAISLENSSFSVNYFKNKMNNLEKTNSFTNEKEDNEIDCFLDLNNSEINGKYLEETFEDNEIGCTDFFPLTIKKKLKNEELSNTEKVAAKEDHNSDDSYEDANIEQIPKNIISEVQRDLFKNNIYKKTQKYGTSDKSEYMKTQEILSQEIKGLEIENIAKKNWTLMGEVKAKDRSINSLLEEDIEFERVTKSVPVITKENISNIEEMIKKRIIDSNFNDVEKIYPKEKKAFYPSKLYEINDEKDIKSLAEIYEDEYNKKNDSNYIEKRDEKIIKEHNEIKELFEEVINKLDSLSSVYYKPKSVKSALNVISNISTTVMEEAQPSSLVTHNMLAPHEIYVTGSEKVDGEIPKRSGIVITKSEMTREEKRRTRRQLGSKRKHKKPLLNRTNKFVDGITKILKKKNVKIIGMSNEKKKIINQSLNNLKEIKKSVALKL